MKILIYILLGLVVIIGVPILIIILLKHGSDIDERMI